MLVRQETSSAGPGIFAKRCRVSHRLRLAEKRPHPRWSQATERDINTGERIPTLSYKGYGEFVASLYE